MEDPVGDVVEYVVRAEAGLRLIVSLVPRLPLRTMPVQLAISDCPCLLVVRVEKDRTDNHDLVGSDAVVRNGRGDGKSVTKQVGVLPRVSWLSWHGDDGTLDAAVVLAWSVGLRDVHSMVRLGSTFQVRLSVKPSSSGRSSNRQAIATCMFLGGGRLDERDLGEPWRLEEPPSSFDDEPVWIGIRAVVGDVWHLLDSSGRFERVGLVCDVLILRLSFVKSSELPMIVARMFVASKSTQIIEGIGAIALDGQIDPTTLLAR